MCVVLPLLAAPLCLLLRHPVACWALAMLTAVAALACAWLMAGGGSATVIEYSFGNWEAPYGIEYRIDALSIPFLLLVGVMTVAALLHARDSVSNDRKHLLHLSVLLHLSGLAGVISTADIFNMFVFIEITSLSAYTLLAMGRQRDALLAAFRYLIQGSIGATFILIGTGYLYAMTGTLNMPDMAERLAQMETGNTVTMAYIFLSLGFAIKFALFPLHGWLVGAYRHAPAAVAALFAATGTKIYLAAWLRVSFTLFDHGQDGYLLGLAPILATAAGLAVIAGTVGALRHQRLRGVLANSTIAHVGYMMLGIATGSQAGLAAALVSMYAHGLMKGVMFLAAGRLEQAAGSDSLRALQGVGRNMPWTMVAVIVAGLGLVGAPLTVGFIGKWQLGNAFVANSDWLALLLLVAGSLGAAGYVYRIVATLLEKPDTPDNGGAPAGASPNPALAARRDWLELPVLLALAAAVALFGVNASLPLEWAQQAASLLLGN